MKGYTVRADFTGGELSSDLGAAILGAGDRRIGMIDRLTAAITDLRDTRYTTHTMRDLRHIQRQPRASNEVRLSPGSSNGGYS
jgi:hypothetical protein